MVALVIQWRETSSKQTAYQTAIKAKQRSQTEEAHKGSQG